MRFAPLTTPDEWQWVKSRCHQFAMEDSQGIIAYDDNDEICAGAVFDTFTVDSCCAHIAVDRPIAIRRGFLHEIARHLFIVCGRKRIFGQVPSTNEKALKFDLHIGFEEVARIPDSIATGVDTIIIRMDKEGCRWLPEELRRAA